MATIHDRLARLSPEQRAQIAGRLSKRNEAPQADPPSLPMAKPDPDHRFDPFPLTEIQQAYWIGRSGAFEMGQVAAHSYLELEDAFDLGRLNASLRAMIDRHDMLRVVILPSGQQQTQHSVPPYQIAVTDLRGLDAESVEARLTAIRHRMSHQLLPTDRYPLFEFHASLLDGGRVRLNMSMDALIFDGWSISLFLREWARLYHDPELRLPELQLTFRDYVLAEQAIGRTDGHRRDRDYWVERVKKMPPGPDLPVAKNPAELASGRFVRRTGRLEPAQWTRLKERAKGAGLTTPGLLLAAYAEVIGLWSQSRQFTINVPRFNRLPLHPQIEGMIGEAASFTLVAIDLDGDEGFEARARRLQQRLWDDLDHALFTGVSVLRELSKLRGSAGALMPVVFTSAPQDSDGRDAYATLVARDLGDVVFAINQTPQVWLDNHVSEQHGALVCDWDWVEELLPPGMSEAMLDAYMRFLERLATEPAAWKLSWTEQARHIMPPEQLARRREINSRTAPIPDVLLHELFARQVPLRGDAPAVIAVDRRLSYRELFRFSNQWGHRLRDAGVKPGDRVAIVMEKGWEQIVAVFAVLQAGAAYVPIDPDQPAERLAYMIGDSESACVLTQASLDARLQWPERPRRLCLDLDAVAALNPEPLPPTQRPEDPAYVIYTSGSTGAPKGVVVSHRNVVNVVACTNARFEIGPDDRAFAVTVLHHDLAVYDIFGLLAAGGAIVIPEQAGRRDPAHWAEVIGREGVTLWNSVPAIMVMLLDYAETHPRAVPASLRLVILGGDWVPVDLPGRLAGCNAATRLLCIGGPTETTIWNIWYPVARVEPSWKSIPYGQPFANNSYHIFGDGWVPRPDWVPGEQYCGGAQLAIGYWRDAERTAAKFLREPRTGERLYRTGDLGRYLPDGNIEFIGRADFQVKINGQRIELGEIEAALRQHPNVRAAVVSVTSSGAKRLVAYVVPNIGASIVAAELRDFVAGKLPEHMLPSFFVPLDQLPLTPNGKVDRKSLPEPRSERSEAAVERRAEDSGTVDQVRRLVAGILQVETVDVDANLLALGANSIDMVRIGNEIEKAFGFRPRMDQIFRLQSARAIADYCDGQLGRTPGKVKDVAAAGMDDELRSIIASFGNLILPAERDAFKDKEPGIRRDDDGRAFVALTPPVVDDALLDRYRNRRSHRRFALKPIPVEQFGRLLACLYQVKLDGKPKYLWPSPGGLYPMQVYLHVKAGRVQGVQAGTYYYHPIKHRLVCLTANVEIDRTIHVPFVNTPVFDEAAFSIFLVSQLAAIAPAYGESSVNFARIEAGILAVLLEQAARDCGLGLCQIGGIDFDRIRPMFQLDKSHLFVHSLLGGAPSSEDASAGSKAAAADAEAARAAQLLERVRQLSPEEARSMLSALKGTGPKVPT